MSSMASNETFSFLSMLSGEGNFNDVAFAYVVNRGQPTKFETGQIDSLAFIIRIGNVQTKPTIAFQRLDDSRCQSASLTNSARC